MKIWRYLGLEPKIAKMRDHFADNCATNTSLADELLNAVAYVINMYALVNMQVDRAVNVCP